MCLDSVWMVSNVSGQCLDGIQCFWTVYVWYLMCLDSVFMVSNVSGWYLMCLDSVWVASNMSGQCLDGI